MNDEELQTRGEAALIRVLIAWGKFKQNHNYHDLKIACCEKSRELFASLDAIENEIRGNNGE